MEQPVTTLGPFSIFAINFGFFRLDGGAMFGSAPKNLWNKKLPADDQNCVRLALRSLIIRFQNKVVLVDVGIGEKWNDKQRKIFNIQNNPLPINPKEVTDIILTHLHFDHAGGISKFDSSNELVPAFPNATVHLQKDNLETAKNPTRKEKASYLPENVNAIDLYRTNIVEGETEIFPGIRVHQVNGHTMGQQWVEVYHERRSVFFPTDLLPTSHHLHPAFHMGYDTCASTLLREKEEFVQRALSRDTLIVLQHDPDTAAIRIGIDEHDEWQTVAV